MRSWLIIGKASANYPRIINRLTGTAIGIGSNATFKADAEGAIMVKGCANEIELAWFRGFCAAL